jgi:hypothetical protein
LYEQVEELALRSQIIVQRKLTLNKQGLGLHLSTGIQEPMKNIKSCSVKLTLKVVKHTVGSLMQHMQEFKGTLAMNDKKEDEDGEEAATKENKEPTSNENKIFTLHFVVDFLRQGTLPPNALIFTRTLSQCTQTLTRHTA